MFVIFFYRYINADNAHELDYIECPTYSIALRYVEGLAYMPGVSDIRISR